MSIETNDFFGELLRVIIRLFTLLLYGFLALTGLICKLISEVMTESSKRK